MDWPLVFLGLGGGRRGRVADLEWPWNGSAGGFQAEFLYV